MSADWTKGGFQRRIIGYHGFRLDGLADVLSRCQGASVFDIGCNRGMVCYEFALNGATVCHGCDEYERGMMVANEVFADCRNVDARFEVVDLTKGPTAIEAAFGADYRKPYDIIVMLAIYHKLRRIMPLSDLLALVRHMADRCGQYFVWRGSVDEMKEFEPQLLASGLRRVHFSEISEFVLPGDRVATLQPAAIWRR